MNIRATRMSKYTLLIPVGFFVVVLILTGEVIGSVIVAEFFTH